MADATFRVQPALDDENRFFWTSGEDGLLRIACCDACGYWLHPPSSYCPSCGGRDVSPKAVSGSGHVWSWTVNHHSWDGSTEPYAIVLVELVEQAGLRLTSNLVGCAPDDVHIGMAVQATFQALDGIWYPLFEPAEEA